MDTPESTHTLVAQDVPAAPAAPQGPGLMDTLPMVLAIIAIFYFLLIRPQQKEAAEHEKLLASLQKGDKVVTGGGLHGEVHEVRDATVVLKLADNVRVEVEKAAVKRKPEAPSGDLASKK